MPDTSLMRKRAFLYPATGRIPAKSRQSSSLRAVRKFSTAASLKIGWVKSADAPSDSFFFARSSSRGKLTAFTLSAPADHKGRL